MNKNVVAIYLMVGFFSLLMPGCSSSDYTACERELSSSLDVSNLEITAKEDTFAVELSDKSINSDDLVDLQMNFILLETYNCLSTGIISLKTQTVFCYESDGITHSCKDIIELSKYLEIKEISDKIILGEISLQSAEDKDLFFALDCDNQYFPRIEDELDTEKIESPKFVGISSVSIPMCNDDISFWTTPYEVYYDGSHELISFFIEKKTRKIALIERSSLK